MKDSRKPTSQRLRELREALKPQPSQGDLATRIGEDQMWVSRRERGKPEPTVEDAILIAEGLGYAAEFVILEKEHRELLSAIVGLSPDDAGLALRFLSVFGRVSGDAAGRKLIRGLIELAEHQTRETVAG